MNMVKNYSVKILLATIVLSNISANTYAEMGKSRNEMVKANQNIYNIKDVYIKWLNDNTTFYVGADILVNAYVNGVLNDDILWGIRALDGKNDVINIQPMGSKAILLASNVGRAEVFAQTNDGTYSMRNIVVKVENYPEDRDSQSIISSNIVPIQSRVVENGKRLVQVEADKSLLNSQQRIDTIDKYLKKLAALGTISNESVNSEHEKYEFYTIIVSELNNIKVELRVDKGDGSYSSIKDKLININRYNESSNDGSYEDDSSTESSDEDVNSQDNNENNTSGSDGQTDNNQGNNSSGNTSEGNNNEINSSEGKYKVPESEITQGLEDIIISGGYGDEKNPIKIDINKDLSIEEQVAIMENYINLLMKNNNLLVSNILETKHQLIYKLRIMNGFLGEIQGQEIKNDFYIEIIINKDNKEEYKSIISMLNKIYKDDTSEENKGVIEDIENIEDNKNKELSIEESNSNKNEGSNEEIEDKGNKEINTEEIPPIFISSAFAIVGIVLIKKSKLIHK